MSEAIVPASGADPSREGGRSLKVVRVKTLGEAIAWLMDKK